MMAVSSTFYRYMLGGMMWTCRFPFLSRAPLIFYKDNASEWKENLFSVSRTPLILYKDNAS